MIFHHTIEDFLAAVRAERRREWLANLHRLQGIPSPADRHPDEREGAA